LNFDVYVQYRKYDDVMTALKRLQNKVLKYLPSKKVEVMEVEVDTTGWL